MLPSASASCPPGYRDVRDAVAWAELPSRSTVFVRGRDALRFVDNFTSAALATLPPGGGAEGFFTDARGWVLALAAILRLEDGLWIDALPGLGGMLAAHLEHYHIREDLEVVDASAEYGAVLVAGPHAAEWLASRGETPPPGPPFTHATGRFGDVACRIASIDWYGPRGYLVQAPAVDLPRLISWLDAAGLPAAAPAAVEAVRIEERLPAPADIVEKTLPQELDRDGRAISFTKGCYLGQETVARIDALGHVNRRLALLAIDAAEPPPPGVAVTSGGEPVGTLTSSCLSPRLGMSAGLALVQRRGLDAAALEVAGAAARVVPAAGAPSRGDT
jgi:folate-binding protein YgfZ